MGSARSKTVPTRNRQKVPLQAINVALRAFDPKLDRGLLERWLRRPHVERWWGNPDGFLNDLYRRPLRSHAIIVANEQPVGYVCWQALAQESLGHLGLSDLPTDLVDVDILIGEADQLGRGIGPRALVLLLAELSKQDVGFAGVGTSMANTRAIRAFELAGFTLFSQFEEPEVGTCAYMVTRVR